MCWYLVLELSMHLQHGKLRRRVPDVTCPAESALQGKQTWMLVLRNEGLGLGLGVPGRKKSSGGKPWRVWFAVFAPVGK